jgi:hypothetical protein
MSPQNEEAERFSMRKAAMDGPLIAFRLGNAIKTYFTNFDGMTIRSARVDYACSA